MLQKTIAASCSRAAGGRSRLGSRCDVGRPIGDLAAAVRPSPVGRTWLLHVGDVAAATGDASLRDLRGIDGCCGSKCSPVARCERRSVRGCAAHRLCQGKAESAKSWKLQRRATDVETKNAAEEIELDPLDPAYLSPR